MKKSVPLRCRNRKIDTIEEIESKCIGIEVLNRHSANFHSRDLVMGFQLGLIDFPIVNVAIGLHVHNGGDSRLASEPVDVLWAAWARSNEQHGENLAVVHGSDRKLVVRKAVRYALTRSELHDPSHLQMHQVIGSEPVFVFRREVGNATQGQHEEVIGR